MGEYVYRVGLDIPPPRNPWPSIDWVTVVAIIIGSVLIYGGVLRQCHDGEPDTIDAICPLIIGG